MYFRFVGRLRVNAISLNMFPGYSRIMAIPNYRLAIF